MGLGECEGEDDGWEPLWDLDSVSLLLLSTIEPQWPVRRMEREREKCSLLATGLQGAKILS